MSKDTVCPTCGRYLQDNMGCPDPFHGTGRVTNSSESPARGTGIGTDEPRGPELTISGTYEEDGGESTHFYKTYKPQPTGGVGTAEWLARMADPLIKGSETFRLSKAEINSLLAAAHTKSAIAELERHRGKDMATGESAGIVMSSLEVDARLAELRESGE